MSNPFAASTSKPGHGNITLKLLHPKTPVLQSCNYQYPLKLIAPNPITLDDENLIHTVFLLTYGGGIVAGDIINLTINLDPDTRLVLLTQGSTKIFKTPKCEIISQQRMTIDMRPGSALCYLPDPVQPFENSAFEQTQIYTVSDGASLCACDWVCQGRSSRGENWNFYKYTSRNEVYLPAATHDGEKRLLLRDNLLFEDGFQSGRTSFADRVDKLGVFGTLILRGPLFNDLGDYFMAEFGMLPPIGARVWDGDVDHDNLEAHTRRKVRQRQETKDDLLWTAASMRGFVLVKFGAREVEGVKRWLSTMLKAEGSLERLFGEGALLCLK